MKRLICMFEQSGTFKNEAIKLGLNAIDLDILDDFGQTDIKIDLFKEISNGYSGEKSIFDDFIGGGQLYSPSFHALGLRQESLSLLEERLSNRRTGKTRQSWSTQ